MASQSIHQVRPGTAAFSEVLDIHRKYKATLGFLPRRGFIERAEKGTLIATVGRNKSVKGYALFDLPRNDIRLIHLAVAEVERGEGMARALVDWIAAEHGARQGIRLSCRRDYPANDFWPKLGFTCIGERKGRGRQSRRLAIWWLGFGHPTLFSQSLFLDPSILKAAVDMNIFIDLLTRRTEGRTSFALEEPWVSEEVDLVLTDEVLNEINRNPNESERDSHRRYATVFPRVSPKNADWQPIYDKLRSLLGISQLSHRDESDLRHAARATAGGAHFLVTRDSAAAKRLRPLLSRVGQLEVVQPHALVQLLDQRRRRALYVPAQLEGTDLILSKVESSTLSSLDPFLDQSTGERGRDLRSLVQTLLARPKEVNVWALSDGKTLLATFAEELNSRRLRVPFLRVRPQATDVTLARQLLFRAKATALEQGLNRIEVTEVRLSAAVTSALIEEYFVPSPRGWENAPLRFLGTLDHFKERLREDKLATPAWLPKSTEIVEPGIFAAELERRYWPAKITDFGLPTFVVPIKPGYAEAMFDVKLSEGTLFPRPRRLGLEREHVYYRSPRGNPGLTAPARVLWYVTESKGIPGTKQVVACSRLEEVLVGSPRFLFKRFQHLGIFRFRDVAEAVSPQGKAMALRFTDTELLPRRVDLEALRGLAAEHGQRVFLRGPWLISEELFEEIYSYGAAI